MSSDNDPNTRYAIQRVDDDTYWNGRGWTRFLKRAVRFATLATAVEFQCSLHLAPMTRVVKVGR